MTSWRKRVTSIKRKDLTLALFSFNSGCFVLHTYTGTVCYGRKGFLVDTATRSYFASFPQDTIHNIRRWEQHTSRENMQVRISLFMRGSPFNPFRLFFTGQSLSLSFLFLKNFSKLIIHAFKVLFFNVCLQAKLSSIELVVLISRASAKSNFC